MPEAPFVRIERRSSSARIILDRPPLNLLTPQLIAELRQGFDALSRDPSVRAAVITGAGRAFTGGMQLQELRDLTPVSAKAFIASLHEAIQSVHEAPFPTLCLINGACLGAGLELAMACDLRVAAENATMGLPEIRVGIPSVIEAALLPALIGPGRAAEFLMTGEPIVARRALEWGLVNRIAAADKLEAVAAELLDPILACGPKAVRLQKELIVSWRNTDLRTAIECGINAFAQAYSTGEPREAMSAFLEKRPPRFD